MPLLHGHDRQRQGRDRRCDPALRRPRARAQVDATRLGVSRERLPLTPRVLLQRILEALRPGRVKPYLGQRGTGQRWETLAAKHLRQEGYKVLDRNFRARSGEIDLIAKENGVLCFIEVKGRRGTGFGAPAEAVTLEKQRRIARAAEEYLAVKHLGSPPCRFDVVAILESEGGTEVTIFRNAFDQPADRSRR